MISEKKTIAEASMSYNNFKDKRLDFLDGTALQGYYGYAAPNELTYKCGFKDGMEAAEKILGKEIKITEEALELLGGHHPQCTCFCMEHRAIYKDTIENLKQLRGEK